MWKTCIISPPGHTVFSLFYTILVNPERFWGYEVKTCEKRFLEHKYFCQVLSASQEEQNLMAMPSSGRSKQVKPLLRHWTKHSIIFLTCHTATQAHKYISKAFHKNKYITVINYYSLHFGSVWLENKTLKDNFLPLTLALRERCFFPWE